MKKQSPTQKDDNATLAHHSHTLEDHIDPKNQKTQHKKITYMQ